MHVYSSDMRLLRDMKFDAANRPEIIRVLTSGMFRGDPYMAHLDELLDAALQDKPSNIARIATSDEDRLFLESIGYGRAMLESTAVGPNYYRVGSEFDFLIRDDSQWNLVRLLNYLKLNAIRPTKRLAVLTSLRNEGVCILEWLAHYRLLGVDSVIVYTNANDDGSDELLVSLSRAGLVTVLQNDTRLSLVEGVQKKAFDHALNFMPDLWDHEWVFFIDADEFLIPNCGEGIEYLLNVIEGDAVYPNSSGMCLNWKWFGSDARYHREPGLTMAKYTHSRPSRFVKTIAKVRDITGFLTSHCPRVIDGCHFVDASLSRLNNSSVQIDAVYDAGQINHYWNKSFEEFVFKNMRNNWERETKLFFEWGNMAQGDPDPLPSGWTGNLQAEIDTLMALPGVRHQSQAVEARFTEMIDDLDRERDLQRMYEDARRAAAAR